MNYIRNFGFSFASIIAVLSSQILENLYYIVASARPELLLLSEHIYNIICFVMRALFPNLHIVMLLWTLMTPAVFWVMFYHADALFFSKMTTESLKSNVSSCSHSLSFHMSVSWLTTCRLCLGGCSTTAKIVTPHKLWTCSLKKKLLGIILVLEVKHIIGRKVTSRSAGVHKTLFTHVDLNQYIWLWLLVSLLLVTSLDGFKGILSQA